MKSKKYNFKGLGDARKHHEIYGGVLLVEGDHYAVCHCVPIRGPLRSHCKCRDQKWLESLAPSWDETNPENFVRLTINEPVQGVLEL